MPNYSNVRPAFPAELREELIEVTERAVTILPADANEQLTVIRGYLLLLSISSRTEIPMKLRRSLAVLADLAEAKGHREFVDQLDSLIRRLA